MILKAFSNIKPTVVLWLVFYHSSGLFLMNKCAPCTVCFHGHSVGCNYWDKKKISEISIVWVLGDTSCSTMLVCSQCAVLSASDLAKITLAYFIEATTLWVTLKDSKDSNWLLLLFSLMAPMPFLGALAAYLCEVTDEYKRFSWSYSTGHWSIK